MYPNVSTSLYLEKLMYQSMIQLTLCAMYLCILMFNFPIFRETNVSINDTVDSLYNGFMYPEGIKAMAEAVRMIAEVIFQTTGSFSFSLIQFLCKSYCSSNAKIVE